jgi:hypothetical protein
MANATASRLGVVNGATPTDLVKQSFKGFVMRIMMMIDMFKKKSDY